jgi:UDPglucose--hexose-1-phosphate uridylyltransferase
MHFSKQKALRQSTGAFPMRFDDRPHRRFNPLKGEWMLVSPHRAKRPWQGQQDSPDETIRPPYDPECYLCPGNARAGGLINPDYRDVFVFDNDFAALLPGANADEAGEGGNPLFRDEPATGVCRVICFSPDHDKTLPEMPAAAICSIVNIWAAQEAELSTTHAYVQIFENKGAMMGCSSPHPHGQIWATGHVPAEPAREDETQRQWLAGHGQNMLTASAWLPATLTGSRSSLIGRAGLMKSCCCRVSPCSA